jgi:hypothetical protein
MHERRTNRSSVPQEAGRLFLDSLVARHELDALVLANEDGLLVVGAARPSIGEPLSLDWIGAVGCVCALRGRRGPSLGALVERATGGRHLEATELTVRGERLYLVAVGGHLPAGPEVAAGIARILARSLPAAA